MKDQDKTAADEFTQQASRGRTGIAREFYDFLRENKKWWLAPIVICVMLLGALVMLSGTAAAPFIYTLF